MMANQSWRGSKTYILADEQCVYTIQHLRYMPQEVYAFPQVFPQKSASHLRKHILEELRLLSQIFAETSYAP